MPRYALYLFIVAALGCVPTSPAAKPQRNDFRLAECAQTYQSGDIPKATEQLTAYTTEYPRDALGWTMLGNCHDESDLSEEALQAYDAALSIDPRQHQAFTGKGVVYRKLGDYDAALENYEKSLEIEPNYSKAHSSMSMIYLQRKQDQKALDCALKAYRLEGDNPVIAANLAVMYHYNGESEKAEELAKVAEKHGYKSTANLRKILSGELSIRD